MSSGTLRLEDPAIKLETRVRKLVARIHADVSDLVYTTSRASVASVTDLLASAPAGLCRELMDAFHTARSLHITKDRLTGRLTAADKLLIDLVLAMYDSSLHPVLPHKPR